MEITPAPAAMAPASLSRWRPEVREVLLASRDARNVMVTPAAARLLGGVTTRSPLLGTVPEPELGRLWDDLRPLLESARAPHLPSNWIGRVGGLCIDAKELPAEIRDWYDADPATRVRTVARLAGGLSTTTGIASALFGVPYAREAQMGLACVSLLLEVGGKVIEVRRQDEADPLAHAVTFLALGASAVDLATTAVPALGGPALPGGAAALPIIALVSAALREAEAG